MDSKVRLDVCECVNRGDTQSAHASKKTAVKERGSLCFANISVGCLQFRRALF